jgi:hypothetical protein
MVQVVECQPSKHKVLSSNPNNTKKKKKEKRKKIKDMRALSAYFIRPQNVFRDRTF